MIVGEIYVWNTDKAQGHELRWKYHLYIGEAGWREEGHAFLFINKANYGEDFEISRTDYGFLTLDVSYICCTSIVTYTDSELSDCSPVKVGQLHNAHAKNLHTVLVDSEFMEGWQIKLCCSALTKFL